MTHTEVGRRPFHQALNDIAVPYALAADWADSGPRRIVEEFAGVLQRTLQLGFIHLRLKDSTEDRDVEATRFSVSHLGSCSTDAISASLASWRHGETADWAAVQPIDGQLDSLRVSTFSMGGDPAWGVIVAGSCDELFPTDEDRILLSLAANYVALTVLASRRQSALEASLADISERRRQTGLQQRLAETAIKINSSLSVAEPVQTILQVVSDAAAEIIGAHMVTLAMTSQGNWAKVMQAVSLSDKYATWRTYDERPTGAGIYSEVCRTNRPLRLTHAELIAHPLFRRFSGATDRHPPLRGWLCVPLIGRDGRNLGALHASDKFAGDFTAEDEAIALQLATIAASAMENCAAYQEILDIDRRKDEFLAVLAHELRNPLAPILAAAAVLRLGHSKNRRIQRVGDVLERQGMQLTRLIDDLLDTSRIGRGQLALAKEVIDIGTVVDRALDAIRPAIAERRHEVTIALPPGPLQLQADATRLTQVLCNLLNNAVKYTEPGGHIWIKVAPKKRDVMISVRDNGIGMPPDFISHAFELFHQAEPGKPYARGGLGIGLSLVRRLVEMHGGTVAAHSQGLHKGSEFVVHLPIAAGHSQ